MTTRDALDTLHWAWVRLLVVGFYKPIAKPIFAWIGNQAETKRGHKS